MAMTADQIFEAFARDGQPGGIALMKLETLETLQRRWWMIPWYPLMFLGVPIKLAPDSAPDNLRFFPSQEMIPRLNRWLAAAA